MANPKYPDVVIELTGQDSNAFTILGLVARGLKRAGVPAEEVAAFRTEAMSGDYDNLLATAMRWVDVV